MKRFSLVVPTLRIRVLLGVSEYQGEELIPLVKRLESLETDTLRKYESKYMLVSSYEYAQKPESALMLVDELINYAKTNKWSR